MNIDAQQLNKELNDGFTALADLQALTAVVMYQQVATALELDNSWAATRLQELSATVAREAGKSLKPQFLNAFAEKIGRYSEQVASYTAGEPCLELIQGGRVDDEPPT